MAIAWYRDGAREDADPQVFGARVGHLHLRVVEVDEPDQPFHCRWGVSANEHPPFENEIDELSLAMGNCVRARDARSAARSAAKRIMAAMGRDL